MRTGIIVVTVAAGCMRPVVTARMTAIEPVHEEEREAATELDGRSCSSRWGLLLPGLGHLCAGRPGTGVTVLALGAAEVGTAVVAATQAQAKPGKSVLTHPAVWTPLLAFQELYLGAAADLVIQDDRAARKLFTPLDSVTDLAASPFNLEVMKRPAVWAGLALATASVIGVSFLIDHNIAVGHIGDRANLFGKRVPFTAGYPLAVGTFAGLDVQVAASEELLFRGVVQSGLARRFGETEGLVMGSLLFTLAHAGTGFGLDGQERRDFFVFKLPWVLATSTYYSWLYKRSGYTLAPSTAMHFWTDLILSAAFFALRPGKSPISASYEMRF